MRTAANGGDHKAERQQVDFILATKLSAVEDRVSFFLKGRMVGGGGRGRGGGGGGR